MNIKLIQKLMLSAGLACRVHKMELVTAKNHF